MKIVATRWFTYEDVRIALSKLLEQDIAGIKICSETGYIVQECSKEEQSPEPEDKSNTPLV